MKEEEGVKEERSEGRKRKKEEKKRDFAYTQISGSLNDLANMTALNYLYPRCVA